MRAEHVRTVRRFHRLVTQRAGALESEFLGRGRPLAESRLLWEIGQRGAELRDLRARLGLDSGYLSRLVSSLEGAGLVRVAASPEDARVRRAELTVEGRAEREELDRRSDALATGVLEPLSDAQRVRLTEAIGQVERLLRLSALRIERVDPSGAEARRCLERYYAELAERFEGGFDASLSIPADPSEMMPPGGAFLVAAIDGEPVACGALRRLEGDVAYLKRMWVDNSLRGLGLGRRMLGALEAEARGLGYRTLRLETNRALTEAIRLYRTSGYTEVAPFNDERYAHHWFEKSLGSRPAAPPPPSS